MAGREKWTITTPASERRVALVVVLVFVVAGSLWILLSDHLLYAVVQDRTLVARLETAKGWAFVASSALLLYAVTRRSAAQLTKAHRTIAAVVESIGDGVLILGSDRTIAYANPASIQMLGVANLERLRGMGAREFSRRFRVSYLDGRLVPPDQFVSQRVFDEAGPIRYSAVLNPPGERETVIACTAAGVRSEIGEPAELVVSVMHDITSAHHLERLRDELLTAAAHALKTPVTVIKSASQVLSARAPSNLRSSTAIIERQCARMGRLVENLLTLSRIRSGTLQLYPVDGVDLGPVVEDVAGEVSRLVPADVHVQLDAHPRVRADHERLVLVLRNAIFAATRSSRPGGPVTVRLGRCGADAEIRVSYQLPSPSVESGDAPHSDTDLDDLGVSRYVTAMVVEAHGGTLTEQAYDDDATVEIRLPAMSEAA
jgi:two-component system phosphate regulon sensor histidine kinase PhoR